MSTLMIKDLAVTEELDRKAMSTVRGGQGRLAQLGHDFYGFNVDNAWMKGYMKDMKDPVKAHPVAPEITQSITQGGNLSLGNALIGGNVVNAPQAINFVG